MGLSISVGYLADLLENEDEESVLQFRGSLEDLNAVLERHGLNPHLEPEVFRPIEERTLLWSFSYSCLHYLRRVNAQVREDPDWKAEPLERGADSSKDPVLEEAYWGMASHLICHSDAHGYYLPQNFEDIIFEDEDTVAGGMVGSSQRLLAELKDVAPALGIRLEGGELPDEEATRINEVIHSNEGLCLEYLAWLALFDTARASVKYNTLIVFH